MRGLGPLQRPAGPELPPAPTGSRRLARNALNAVAAVIRTSAWLLPGHRSTPGGSWPAGLGQPSDALRQPAPDVTRLVYELLDAHDDTAAIASELARFDVRWQQHLAYLRSLQRTGRATLAHLTAEEVR